jgi:hypothetical protein
MCEKCIEIDTRIARYREVSKFINDRLALDGIKSLIVDLETQKASLHPTPEPGPEQ